MFSETAIITTLPLASGARILVIDGALERPRELVAQAARQAAGFARKNEFAYPGLELAMPVQFNSAWEEFFRARLRAHFPARKLLQSASRLSITTLQAHELKPAQWIAHRDDSDLAADEIVIASVLYLFDDFALGGTSFWRPTGSQEAAQALVVASMALDGAQFSARFGVLPGYSTQSNQHFELMAVVPPAFNRMVVYDGATYHSAHITETQALTADPATGRLTLNGFLTCRRSAV